MLGPYGALIGRLIDFYALLIFVYVILSWVPAARQGSGFLAQADRLLATVCEPYISLFRRILPVAMIGGAGIDFSPFVALLVLQLVARLLR